jgi:signal transduction histidine kinase
LCHNSLDAMASGGELGISAGHSIHTAHSGVFIEVSDTGSGIAKRDLAQAFQPFFTTGKRHGTGLGLAICRNIAEAHDGDITLTSEPGRGTKARLWLPLRPTPELAGMTT